MATPLRDFIEYEFYPRLYPNLNIAFPEMQFKQMRGKWGSPFKINGSRPKEANPAKTVVLEKTPFLLQEGGEPNQEILKWAVDKYGYKNTFEAVKDISARIGLAVPEMNPEEFNKYQKRNEAYNELWEISKKALFEPGAKEALTQLTEGRRYTEEEIKEMGLGFITPDIAEKYKEFIDISPYVTFNNQILIPSITNGKLEGFQFLKTNPEARGGKYVNNKGYEKSKYLSGLSVIPMTGTARNESLIYAVDGILKALYANIKGLDNIVATGGSDKAILSEEQVKQAKIKGVKHIVIIPDNESTEKERANETRKIEQTLKWINEAGLSGYVAYLPHEDTNRKEDIEDYLQKYGIEKLKDELRKAKAGATFRTEQIFKRIGEKVGNRDLTDIEINNLYREIAQLLTEYQGTDHAFILITANSLLGENAPEWKEVLKEYSQNISKIRAEKHKEILARKLGNDINQALEKGDFNGVIRATAEAKEELEKNKSAEFAPMFAPRKWSDTEIKLGERSIGITTQYQLKRGNEIDKLILPSGGLSIIAAPTNHGKSTMLQNLALQSARNKDNKGAVLYFTFEEDPESVSVQFLSKIIGTEISKDNKRSIKSYYRGNPEFIKPDKFNDFEKGRSELKKLIESGKLWINGTEAINGISIDVITPLKRIITQATKEIEGGVSAVFIDYVQLIQPDIRINSRVEELKIICTELKNLAVRLNLPIVLAAQFSREGSKSPYELEAECLGEGGDIERASALIIGLWNTSKKPRQYSRFWDKKSGEWIAPPNPNLPNGIEFDPNDPKIYIRLLKSRGEATGGEALLNCNLNIGLIYSNITEEITEYRNNPQVIEGKLFPEQGEEHRQGLRDPDEELPF